MKNPVGRPRKTLNDLPNNWQLTLDELGRRGRFDMDAKVALGLSNDTFDRLLEDEPEFLEAVSRMRQFSETWWTSISIKSFEQGSSKNINSNLYALMLRNAFKRNWNEAQTKVDITTGGDKIDGNKKIEIEIIKTKIEDGEIS
jgi:hypothetical protein